MLTMRNGYRHWLALPLMLALLAGGAFVLSQSTLAKPPDHANNGGKGGGNGGGDDDDGGGGDSGALDGTVYFRAGGDMWKMNTDGSEKALVIEGLDFYAAPSRDLHDGERWFVTAAPIAGEFYPIHLSPPELFNGAQAGDLADWSYVGDALPGEAWWIDIGFQIDGEGNPDTFEWGITNSSIDSSMFPIETDVPITGGPQTLDVFGDGSAVLTVEFAAASGHALDDGWIYHVEKGQRQELFAVSESGESIQLSGDPDVELISRARWAPDDALVSAPGQQWLVTHVDGDGNEYGDVVETGIYAVPADFDSSGPMPPALLVNEQVVDVPWTAWHSGVGNHAWSPDGFAVAYSFFDPIDPDDDALIVADLMEESSFTLAGDVGYFGGIDWSPSGEWIAFGGMDGVERIRSDGGDRSVILKDRKTRGNFTYFSFPRWSPDGNHLVCDGAAEVDFFMLHHDVWRIQADGKKAVNLTDDFDFDAEPRAWR